MCCSTRTKSQLDYLFDKLPIRNLSPKVICRMLSEIQSELAGVKIKVDDLMNFCAFSCMLEDEKDDLSNFWLKVYTTIPDNYFDANLFFVFTVLAAPSQHKIYYLVDGIEAMLDPDNGSISRQKVKKLLTTYVTTFTKTTLSYFIDMHEADEHFEFEKETAFKTKQIDNFVENKFFIKHSENHLNAFEFFEEHLSALENIAQLRSELREFARENW